MRDSTYVINFNPEDVLDSLNYFTERELLELKVIGLEFSKKLGVEPHLETDGKMLKEAKQNLQRHYIEEINKGRMTERGPEYWRN
jgi:hypothetical protein